MKLMIFNYKINALCAPVLVRDGSVPAQTEEKNCGVICVEGEKGKNTTKASFVSNIGQGANAGGQWSRGEQSFTGRK